MGGWLGEWYDINILLIREQGIEYIIDRYQMGIYIH